MTSDVTVVLQETAHPLTVTVNEVTEEIVVEVANIGLVGSPGRATPEFLAAVASAEAAGVAAETAKDAAEFAQTAAEAAQTISEEASVAATGAQTLAASYAASSESSATASETASTASSSARDAAQVAQSAAETARSAADSARVAAQAAKTAAETARDAAQASAASMSTSVTATATSTSNATSSAQEAQIAAAQAAASRLDAIAARNEALAYAADAATAVSLAQASADSAATSATTAATHKTAAQSAKSASELARDNALAAQTAAELAQAAAENASLILEWDGTQYPGRSGAGPRVFSGPVNPYPLGLMTHVGDVWINTAAPPSVLTVEEAYTNTVIAMQQAQAAASKFPAAGLAPFDYNTLRNADFKIGADGFSTLSFASGLSQARVSDPDYLGGYYIQLTNTGGVSTNVLEWSAMGRHPWKKNEKWFFSIDIQSDTPMQLGGSFLPNDITTGAFITGVTFSDRSPAIPGDGNWYRCYLVFDTNIWPSNTGTGRIRMQGVPTGANIKIRRPKFGKTPVYIDPSDQGVTYNLEHSRYEKVGVNAEDLPWLSSGTPKNGSLLIPDFTQPNAWRWSTTRYLEGTGSPEGVVAAEVGVEYIDLTSANGARKWRKRTGTGSTGWEVLEGDTGWRKIIGWTNGTLDLGVMPTGLGPYAGTSTGGVFLRRVRSRVFMNILNAKATSTFTVPLPTGFNITNLPYAMGTVQTGWGQQSRAFTAGFSSLFVDAGAGNWFGDGGNSYGAQMEWELRPDSTVPWPTSLPGNPS